MDTDFGKNLRELSEKDIQEFFMNFLTERDEIDFSESERAKLKDMMFYGLEDEKKRAFFFYHFVPLIRKALGVFLDGRDRPLVIELGCGSGSTSILLGLLGAKVVGIDHDEGLISASRKRQKYYEKEYGSLDVQFQTADAFKFDLEQFGPLDGIYSLFAFNLMQPSKDLLKRLVPALKTGGNLVVSDGNRSALVNALFRRRPVLKPGEMKDNLSALGCEVTSLEYDCVIPPKLVASPKLFPIALKIEKALNSLGLMRWLGVSYTVVAEKPTPGK